METTKIPDPNLLNIKIIKIYIYDACNNIQYNQTNGTHIINFFLKNYKKIHCSINHQKKSLIMENTKLDITYNRSNYTYLTSPLLSFLIKTLNSNMLNTNTSTILVQDNSMLLDKFFKNFFFCQFKNNFIDKDYLEFIKSFSVFKLKSGFVKKLFGVKYKNKYKNLDKLPKRLKNFFLKKLIKSKYKQSFFIKTCVSPKFNISTLLFKYLSNFKCKNNFSIGIKNQCTELSVHNPIYPYHVFFLNSAFKFNLLANTNTLPLIRFNLKFSLKSNFFFNCIYTYKVSPIWLNTCLFSSSIITYKLTNPFNLVSNQINLFIVNDNLSHFSAFAIPSNYLSTNSIVSQKPLNFDKIIFSNIFLKSFVLNTVNTPNNKLLHFRDLFFINNLHSNDTNNLTSQPFCEGVRTYSNYSPIAFFKKSIQECIFLKFKKNTTPQFYKYFYHYISSYLESSLKKKIFLRINTKLQVNVSSLEELNIIFGKHRSSQSKVGRGFFFFEMLEIIFISFLHKDLNLLIDWFVKTMERIQFRNHKKFLTVFKFIITSYSDLFIYKNNVGGFFFDIRGKVGVAGNAKKRHFSFNEGRFSKTTKLSKFDYQQQIVRTFTGALGVTMVMYF